MAKYDLRLAEEADAAEIAGIYAHYVSETPITFEVEPPTADEIGNRIRSTSAEYPYIVCVSNDKIIGYAYAHRQKERAAYGWNAELSVYIDGAYQRGGIGKALYGALIDILRLQNVQNVYGGVTVPNMNSEKLHEHLGFVRLGTYHQTGYKLGRWHDVALFEKAIGEHGADPKPFVPLKNLDQDAVGEMLSQYIDILNK
jgi:phosphinothricin acetyltransferase